MTGVLSMVRIHAVRAVAVSCALVLAPAAAQAQNDVPPPSIGAVFKEVPGDLWRFLSLDTAAIVGGGATAAAAAHSWDSDFADEVETNARFNAAMDPGHTYGAFGFQALVGAGLYATGWLARHGTLARAGADIMRAQIVSQAYVQAIKFTAQRTRPNGSNDQSFPSGHSASAFASATVLNRYYGWKIGVPATIAAAYVATARVHDNRHYLTDVVFGSAMGIAGQRTVMLRGGRYGLTVAPNAVPGGTGVLITVQRP